MWWPAFLFPLLLGLLPLALLVVVIVLLVRQVRTLEQISDDLRTVVGRLARDD